jgi:predicted dehydrogenase
VSEATGFTTFIKERATDDGGTGIVDVDDAFAAAVELENGATGTFEATRFATGRKNYNCFEINGEKGSVRFNLVRLNEVDVFWVGSEPHSTQGWTNVLVSEGIIPGGVTGGPTATSSAESTPSSMRSTTCWMRSSTTSRLARTARHSRMATAAR